MEKEDLTLLEDLGEFLHKDDPETDAKLAETSPPPTPNQATADTTGDIDVPLDEWSSEEPDSSSETPSEFEDEPTQSNQLEDQLDFSSSSDDSFDFSTSEESSSEDSDLGESAGTFTQAQDDFFSSDQELSADENSESEQIEGTEEAELNFSAQEEPEETSWEQPENDDDIEFSSDGFDSNEDSDTFSSSSFEPEEEVNQDEQGPEESAENELNFDAPEPRGDYESNTSSFNATDSNTTALPASDETPVQEPTEVTLPSKSDEPTSVGGDFEEDPKQEEEQKKVKVLFEDIREFSESLSYGVVTGAANPAFSVILKNIKYKEDAEDILILLKEHGICKDGQEDEFKKSLSMGSIIISQISEYSAIYLAHKFRKLDLDIMVGLADEVRKPANYQEKSKGLTTKAHITQNRKDYKNLADGDFDINSIILTTTPTIEDMSISKYLGIVSEFKVFNELELFPPSKDETASSQNQSVDPTIAAIRGLEVQWQDSKKSKDATKKLESSVITDVYTELANKLKPKAVELGGNAIVGVNYQITPLLPDAAENVGARYKVICTGNVVMAF